MFPNRVHIQDETHTLYMVAQLVLFLFFNECWHKNLAIDSDEYGCWVEGDKFEYKICFDFELLVEMRICPLSWLKV